jgi:hypothetical protein
MVTPEQSKLFWSAADEVAHWIVIAFIGWGVQKIRKSIASIRPGIVADVTRNVQAHFETMMNAHEAMDVKRFAEAEERTANKVAEIEDRTARQLAEADARKEQRLGEIRTRLDSIDVHLRGRTRAHGD